MALFAFDEFVIEPGSGAGIETSIAVLPFSNRSALADDVFFVDGIHDDILTQLANLSGLEKVISRTSVQQYRDTAKSMLQIGKELGVANILEGGVQRAGNRLRINMQLIDAATDKHLWAETYDREMTIESLFAVQSEISREIVAALNAVLSEQDDQKLDRVPTISLEAYGEYVLGRQDQAKRTVEDLDKAIAHFEQAIKLDPEYALPYIGLSDSLGIRAWLAREDSTPLEEQRQGLINRALALDPLLGEAWASKGLLSRDRGDRDRMAGGDGVVHNKEAADHYQKALELSPNYSSAYQWYSHILNHDESTQEQGMQYLKKAIELDPLADILKINLTDMLRNQGRFEESLEALTKGQAQNPDFVLYYQSLGVVLAGQGRIAEGLQWTREGTRRAPIHRLLRIIECWLLLELAADQSTELCLSKLDKDFPTLGSFSVADLYTQRGDYEKSLSVRLDHHAEREEDLDKETLAWAYLDTGDIENAMNFASEISSDHFGQDPVSVQPRSLNRALQAVALLQTQGRQDRADEVARAMLDTMQPMYRIGRNGFGFADVEVHVLQGDRQKALAALREAIDSGQRTEWWHLRMPYFASMLEEPEWNAMMSELEADIARQRDWYEQNKE